jgi:hypothetical protein
MSYLTGQTIIYDGGMSCMVRRVLKLEVKGNNIIKGVSFEGI